VGGDAISKVWDVARRAPKFEFAKKTQYGKSGHRKKAQLNALIFAISVAGGQGNGENKSCKRPKAFQNVSVEKIAVRHSNGATWQRSDSLTKQ